MKVTTHALVVVVVVVVVMVVVVCGGGGESDGNNNHHHNHHHHRRRRSVETPHGTHRIKREQGAETTTVSGMQDTEPPTTTTTATLKCAGTGGDECAALLNSACDKKLKICVCVPPYVVYDAENSHCGKVALFETSCTFDSECEAGNDYSMCSENKVCTCAPGFVVDDLPGKGMACIATEKKEGPGAVDSAMIGVLAGLALMFIIICVVLRLFSKARFRENRSIFNTPNPRLMNASLFKDIDVAGRRGSTLSTASATGSAHAHPTTAPSAAAKTPSPVREDKKAETTVAIETVD